MPPPCRWYGPRRSRLFIPIEEVHFQNSIPDLAEVTLSNCANILDSFNNSRYWLSSDPYHLTVMKTPTSLRREPFPSPYRLLRHRLGHLAASRVAAELASVYPSVSGLFGCVVLVCQRLAVEKWVGGESLNATNRTRHKAIEASSLILPKT